MEVVPVSSRKSMKAFVNLPRLIYQDSLCWAPPIWREEGNAYRGRSNVMLRDNDYILFLVYDGGILLGRNLVYIDA